MQPREPAGRAASTQQQQYAAAYAADRSGSLVGLVTFGDEVLGLESVLSDQLSVDFSSESLVLAVARSYSGYGNW